MIIGGNSPPFLMNFIEIELTQWRVFFGSHPLALEDVAEMTAAVRADDLDTRSIRVRSSSHRAVNLIVKAGPPAMTLEFVIGADRVARCTGDKCRCPASFVIV